MTRRVDKSRSCRPALSAEDEKLWRHATRNVQPLKSGAPGIGRREALLPARPALKAARPALAAPGAPVTRPVSPAPRPEPMEGPANRQWARRLARGDLAIDARLDLHGLTQASAHARLERFLAHAQARNFRVLLVITGKGGDGGRTSGNGGSERGVLRRAVPRWLRESAMSAQILSISAAHPRHGGSGAYYVILRRRRD